MPAFQRYLLTNVGAPELVSNLVATYGLEVTAFAAPATYYWDHRLCQDVLHARTILGRRWGGDGQMSATLLERIHGWGLHQQATAFALDEWQQRVVGADTAEAPERLLVREWIEPPTITMITRFAPAIGRLAAGLTNSAGSRFALIGAAQPLPITLHLYVAAEARVVPFSESQRHFDREHVRMMGFPVIARISNYTMIFCPPSIDACTQQGYDGLRQAVQTVSAR